MEAGLVDHSLALSLKTGQGWIVFHFHTQALFQSTQNRLQQI